MQVMIVETADELRTLATKHLDQLLVYNGTIASQVGRPCTSCTIASSSALHHVLLESKAEIDQFAEGLETYNMLNTIKEHPRASSTRINFR